MKNLRQLLVLMCLLAITTAWGNPINENQARSIAANFMTSHAMPATSLRMAHKAPLAKTVAGSESAAYYVFNGNNGFVIVAGDDRAPAVLGYSDKGTFNSQELPEQLQELLESYATQIQALAEGAKPVLHSASGPAILPLVTASWSQNSPYNTMLPMLPNGQQAVAGCVATAMAQMLYYWKQPAQATTTIPEYTSKSLGIYMPALEPVEFNWEAMQDTYMSNDTESEGAQAAARLTLYCAQSVNMNFMYGTSSANTALIPSVLSTYFGYKASAHCEYRENFSTQGWSDLIYNELAEGRPVVYSGSKKSSGHAFICDGYDGEGMFHMNWGWDGMSNGYYLLNVLNPDAQGTGSANEAYGYIYGQFVVVGIEPGEAESEFALTATDVALNGAITARESSSDNFTATVSGHFCNYTIQTMAVYFGWGFYQGEDLLNVLYRSGSSALPPSYYFTTDAQPMNFGSGLTSGTYRIVPIYAEYGTTNWRPCKGADVNYIEVTIDGNECTVIGHGTAGMRDYQVNEISCNGPCHHGRPVNLIMSVTNNGYSQNDMLYMFVNGTFNSTAYLGLEYGETGDIYFQFLPPTPGIYTCTFSLNEDGSDPLCQTTITVTEMPAANLSITPEVLNVTDYSNKIVTSDKFNLKLTLTNNGTDNYFDDITVKLYKNTSGNSGNLVQAMNQQVFINPNQTTDVQFDFDNVIDGCRYFAAIYYYSAGQAVFCTTTSFYTIQFPSEPEFILGDVNDDGEVDIADVTVLIDYLLNHIEINAAGADVNGDNEIDIADVTALIDMLLGS